jgi:peptidoglycan hydrolase CwlO-like protein
LKGKNEELEFENKELEDKIKELEEDIQENYRPVPVAEQVGISDKDFI